MLHKWDHMLLNRQHMLLIWEHMLLNWQYIGNFTSHSTNLYQLVILRFSEPELQNFPWISDYCPFIFGNSGMENYFVAFFIVPNGSNQDLLGAVFSGSGIQGSICSSVSKNLKIISWCRFLLWLGKLPHMLLYQKIFLTVYFINGQLWQNFFLPD